MCKVYSSLMSNALAASKNKFLNFLHKILPPKLWSLLNCILKIRCLAVVVNTNSRKGPSIKDVCSQGEGLVQCRHFVSKGFRCGRPHFLVQKTSDFSKFMLCPHGQGRDSASADVADNRGGGQFFLRFCTNVFHRRAPNW